jgi:Bacterial TniB protein
VVTSTDTHADVADGPVDLSHLHPAAQQIARLPDAERLRYVRADRWIGYTRATAALERLETLFSWPSKQRMPNLLLIGPTNNGKSMIVEKFRRAHPPISHEDREEIPVLVVQMPSEPSVTRFYTALLAALGAPMRTRYRIAELEQLVLRLLRAAGVRTLVIDELHNVLGGRADTRREFLNLLRYLGNELRIPLVGVGIRDAYLAIRADDQLENRFAPLTLPRWEPDADACSLLASFAASFPLRRPSPIVTEEMAAYLLTRSEGTIGELVHLLTDAAIAAIESGEEAINQRTLLIADYAGPTERRRLFERELT